MHVEILAHELAAHLVLTRPFVCLERWTPSFGQVFVTAKVESGVMIQATLG